MPPGGAYPRRLRHGRRIGVPGHPPQNEPRWKLPVISPVKDTCSLGTGRQDARRWNGLLSYNTILGPQNRRIGVKRRASACVNRCVPAARQALATIIVTPPVKDTCRLGMRRPRSKAKEQRLPCHCFELFCASSGRVGRGATDSTDVPWVLQLSDRPVNQTQCMSQETEQVEDSDNESCIQATQAAFEDARDALPALIHVGTAGSQS